MKRGSGMAGAVVLIVGIILLGVAGFGITNGGTLPGAGITALAPCATVSATMTYGYSPTHSQVYANDTSSVSTASCAGFTNWGPPTQIHDWINISAGTASPSQPGAWGQRATATGVPVGTAVTIEDTAMVIQIVSGTTYVLSGATGVSFTSSTTTQGDTCYACVSGSLSAAFTGTAAQLLVTVTDASVISGGATVSSASIAWGDSGSSVITYHGMTQHTYGAGGTYTVVETVSWTPLVASLHGGNTTATVSASITLPGYFSFGSNTPGVTTPSGAIISALLIGGVLMAIAGLLFWIPGASSIGWIVVVVAIVVAGVTYFITV